MSKLPDKLNTTTPIFGIQPSCIISIRDTLELGGVSVVGTAYSVVTPSGATRHPCELLDHPTEETEILDLETVERDTHRDPLFVSSGKVAEPWHSAKCIGPELLRWPNGQKYTLEPIPKERF